MKRNYRNETIVDFQGRSKRQQVDNEKIGLWSLVLLEFVLLVGIGIMILIHILSK